MLPSFCRDSITVKRGRLAPGRGAEVIDWSNPIKFTIDGCSVQPSSTSRDFDGRSLQVTEEWTLFAPSGSDLKAGDRIEWSGLSFEVDGAPMPWQSPTGRVSHIWARLKEWRG